MPPKQKITKNDIIIAACEIVRTEGADALNARRVADYLRCSTQPVFSNFSTMGELRTAVIGTAEALFRDTMRREIESGEYPPYKASGMAYIRFAAEEGELFKLLYMRDRRGEDTTAKNELFEEMTAMLRGNGVTAAEDADLFHLEIWAVVHGIAVMVATGYFTPDRELVSRMLTDVYQGLRNRYEQKKEQEV